MLNNSVTLLNDFPRSMGCPHQDFIAWNEKERDNYINERKYNTDLYISVYKFNQVDENGELERNSAHIDKIFFDFDGEEYEEFWLSNVRKLHQWCKKYNIIHRAHYSGNGGHFFIYIEPNIIYKKEAVGNFQRYLQKKLNLKIDKKIIGDTSRIFRYPNTYNFKGRRWCIPIKPEDLDNESMNEMDFMKQAIKPKFWNSWCGTKLLNISTFDIDELLYMEYDVDYNIEDIDDSISTEFPEFPPCVQSWLSTPHLNSKGKFYLILYLKDQIVSDLAFDSIEIISILKKTLDPVEFEHYFGMQEIRGHLGHNGKKFKSIMLNNQYKMVSCKTLRKFKLCPKDCGRLHPINIW